MTNLDKIKTYLEQHGHGTTNEIATQFGWKKKMADSLLSRAHTYRHVEIAGKQPSIVSAKHWAVIWRLRRPAVVSSASFQISASG